MAHLGNTLALSDNLIIWRSMAKNTIKTAKLESESELPVLKSEATEVTLPGQHKPILQLEYVKSSSCFLIVRDQFYLRVYLDSFNDFKLIGTFSGRRESDQMASNMIGFAVCEMHVYVLMSESKVFKIDFGNLNEASPAEVELNLPFLELALK